MHAARWSGSTDTPRRRCIHPAAAVAEGGRCRSTAGSRAVGGRRPAPRPPLRAADRSACRWTGRRRRRRGGRRSPGSRPAGRRGRAAASNPRRGSRPSSPVGRRDDELAQAGSRRPGRAGPAGACRRPRPARRAPRPHGGPTPARRRGRRARPARPPRSRRAAGRPRPRSRSSMPSPVRAETATEPGCAAASRAASVGVRIGLVEDEQLGHRGGVDLGQHRADRVDLLARVGRRGVDHVHEEVGVDHHVEGRAEGLDQLVGQLAHEADGVGDAAPARRRADRAGGWWHRGWRTGGPRPARRRRSGG